MRWLLAIFLSSLPVAAPAGAENEPAAPSLDAARSDLQALQAAREENRLGDAVKSAPPPTAPAAAALPALETAAAPAVLDSASGQKSKDDKSHWLLDAMEAQKKNSDSILSDEKSSGQDLSSLADTQNTAEPAAGPKSEPPPPVVANPLTPYLNQWMTPQDYTLLGRPPAGETAAPAGPAGLPGESTREAEGLADSGLADGLNAPPALAGGDARSNPYLDGIADLSPLPATPVLPLPPLPPAGAASAPAPATPPPFAPSDDNEKYFPQLKDRF
ncbi:MAG TPA: hypothetical protein VMI53_09950 [Opitutaceae bacterium]|nr:hypothetical protein [Opitutaceae bacterium]